jgi:hypothetical protein
MDLLREDGEWARVSYSYKAEEGAVARVARISYEAEKVQRGAVARRTSLNLTPETPGTPPHREAEEVGSYTRSLFSST